MSDPNREIVTDLFPTMSTAAVDHLLRSMRRLHVPASTTVFSEGEIQGSFYLIASGSVDVFKIMEGQRLLIGHLEKGAHFGDIALLLDQPRSATIITAEPCDLLVIDRDLMRDYLKDHAEIVVALSQMLIRRFLVQQEKHLTEIARLKKRTAEAPTIFVSYSRADHLFVTRLVNHLLKHNINVWLDLYQIDPGKSWARQIGEALDHCQLMLLVLSPQALASENVDDEWNYFLDHKKKVVSVMHQPCKLPYRLAKLQYVDFHATDFDTATARLVATLNTTPSPLVPA